MSEVSLVKNEIIGEEPPEEKLTQRTGNAR
jgi:hypothetical protein